MIKQKHNGSTNKITCFKIKCAFQRKLFDVILTSCEARPLDIIYLIHAQVISQIKSVHSNIDIIQEKNRSQCCALL